MLRGRVLLTGGSGTLGRAMLLAYLRKRDQMASSDIKFTVFARSESRLARLKRAFPEIVTVVGDVRDARSVQRAVAGHDVVIHMAAMKRIPECEDNASECIQVNVGGTENVLAASATSGVRDVVVISTDKACQAATVYGASKLLTEGLLASYAKSFPHTMFHGVRYGNVIASNGSVVQLWEEQNKATLPLSITHPEMTRFWMSPFDAIKLIEKSMLYGTSVIAVPAMSALSITDMAHMLHPNVELELCGLRSNEKLSEDLLHPYEPVMQDEARNVFLICTNSQPRWKTGWSYSSDVAPKLSTGALHKMIADAREVEECW